MKFGNLLDIRGRRRLGGVLAQIILISLVVGMFQIPVSAAGNACHTSSPPSAAYSVTVCITAPADGATINGVRTVAATVTVTGTNPGVARVIFNLNGQYLLTEFQVPF